MTATTTDSLASALAELQTQLPKVGKGKKANTGTYSYSYADLADISDKVLPLLGKLGLSFSSMPMLNEQGQFVLRYKLRHTSGESDGGDYPLRGGTPQAIGSEISYSRRYTLCAVTGIAPDDDDGHAAQAHAVAQARRQSAYTRGSDRDKPAGAAGTITQKQLGMLHKCLTDYGLGDNRDAALAFYAETIGREVSTSKDLTTAEASKVIDRLVGELEKGVDVEPDPTLDEGYQP